MIDFLRRLFDTSDFPARWHCGNWTPGHGWLHIVSDLGVWSAYVAIPLVLGYFFWRRKDLPFRRIFLLFGAFIFACGTTHLMEAIIFWWPAYRLAGVIKLFTAIVSWSTVLALIPAVPRVLGMRSPEELEREIAARERAEAALRKAHEGLEHRVEERTEELGRANAALRDADRRKDEFLAMLGHELRNPLAAIRNGLHILHLTKGNGAIKAQIQEMLDKQTNNLTRMVDDLLDVSRITRGKIQLRKEKVELAAAISHATESVRPLIEAQRHRLTLTLPPRPVYLQADPTRLEQVLVNLLNNAAKYTKQGGFITLAAERTNGEVLIRVRDTGVGMSAELLSKVFDLFTQSERSLDRSQGGLGIGLTLVKKLVEMHGGSVTAHSDGPERGSEFIVCLPALHLDEERADLSAEQQLAVERKLRVLIVEDAEDVAESLKVLLEVWGHDVRVVYDGPAALVAYRTYQPDVVLLDLGLPGMNGYDVARQLRREQRSRRPFLMAVTGYGQDEDKRQSQEAGFDYHMTKPILPEKLQTLIASAPAFVGN